MPTPPTKAPVRITIKTSTEPQRAFWASDARFRLFVGGVGSGKTHAGAIEVLRMPARTVGMVIAPNFRMLRDATLRSLHSVLGRMIVDEQKVNMNLTLSNGTTVMLRSADDPSRLRGPNLGWAWLDEAAIMDGASPLQLFRLVYLPLMMPSLVAIGTYAILLAWNEYLYAFLLLSKDTSITLPVALGNFLAADDSPWELLMTTGLIYALPPAAIYYAFRKYMVSGLTAGAVKS